MRQALLVAWSATLGAAAGMTLAVLGSLTWVTPLTSGDNTSIAGAGFAGVLLGALLGGWWGWRRVRDDGGDK